MQILTISETSERIIRLFFQGLQIDSIVKIVESELETQEKETAAKKRIRTRGFIEQTIIDYYNSQKP